MMKYPKVCVLMSTYNGEKYIREQIDSILEQKEVDVKLIIRDDGSTDSTQEICKQYVEKYNNIQFYQGNNIGVGRSFLELLRRAPEADYYSFADQDDVWFEDKLLNAVNMIQKVAMSEIPKQYQSGYPIKAEDLLKMNTVNGKNDIAVLYGSNLIKTDSKLNEIGFVYNEQSKFDLCSSITRNNIYGCTMVMNRNLRDICVNVKNPSDRVLKRKNHDGWSLYIAYIKGIFFYDSNSYLYYREHENQVVGAKEKRGIDILVDRAKRLIQAKNKGVRSQLARDLLDRFSEEMEQTVKEKMKIISQANTFLGARELIKHEDLVESFGESKKMIIIRGLLGWI